MQQQDLVRNLFVKLTKGQGVGAVLARGSGFSMVVTIIGTGIGLILQVILARTMGVQNFGEYTFVLSWISVLVLIGRLGFDTASFLYIPKYKVKGNWGQLRGFLIRSQQIVILSSILVALSIFIVVWSSRLLLGDSLTSIFYVGAIVLPMMALLQLYGSRLRGLKKILSAQVPFNLLRPLIMIVLVVLISYIYQVELTGYIAMLLYLISMLLSLLFSIVLFNKSLYPEVKNTPSIFLTKEWIKVSTPLLIISGLQIVMGQMDIIMLGSIVGTEESGIYSTAHRVAILSLIGLQAVNMIAAPLISEFFNLGDMRRLQRMVGLASWWIFSVSLVSSILLILFGKWVLSLFGLVFIQAYIPLLILIIGNVFNALCGSVGFILNMTGNQNISIRIIASALVLNLVLNTILIPEFGMMGAAIATTSTVIYWNLFMCIIVIRKIKINPTIFSRFK